MPELGALTTFQMRLEHEMCVVVQLNFSPDLVSNGFDLIFLASVDPNG